MLRKRRCFYNCESKYHLYGLPKEDSVKNQWFKFMFTTVPQTYKGPYLYLCYLHFEEHCFLNWAQVKAGFSQKLMLIEGSVPTLLGHSGDSGSQPAGCASELRLKEEQDGSIPTVRDQSVKSEPDDIVVSYTALLTPPATMEYIKAECASELGLNEGGSIPTVQDPSVKPKPGTADCSCRILPPVRHVASQTDPPKIKSVGTQLSMQTLQNPFRSKAIQVKIPSRDCGVGTDTFPLDSPLLLLQPTLVKRPSKRPRLSLQTRRKALQNPDRLWPFINQRTQHDSVDSVTVVD
ncbi:uncharacterized protein LOC116049247 isoform X3 [Sander lucioperca]|uniref:uncharacterized protein LOC116049247 isoform X3 n=1 Tax=Sander lucioperca TaxID=283035 RepID=UPI00125E096E|nr:uncharacterized protein LOC116049247 isoform X3 [Sander lucioperca]